MLTLNKQLPAKVYNVVHKCITLYMYMFLERYRRGLNLKDKV